MRPIRMLLGLVAGLIGCGFDVEGESAYAPPAQYRIWWEKTEACSGLSGSFDRIHWEVVPGHDFSCASGECVGHWQSDHRIFIASDWTSNEMVVRHEMLHDLVGQPGHPNPPFGQGCPLTWATWSANSDQ